MQDVLMKADLQDLASPKLEKLKRNLQQTGNNSTALGAAFGDLKGKASEMGVPLDKLESYFGTLPKAVLGSVAAVGALGAGMVALGMHSIQVGADLQDLSDTTGLSVESLSGMRNVLASSNMDVKGYADAISKLSIRIGENGASFKKQGIDVSSAETAFDQIKRKIADTEDPIKRAKIANEAFGKSYKDLMPLLTMANDEYDKLKGNTSVFSSEFAANAAKVDDNIALLKTTFSDFAVQLGANFLPMMESLVGLLSEAADYWGNLANGPSVDQQKAEGLDAIHQRYASLQAESDRGAKVLGQAPQAVRIDGKTEFEAMQAYLQTFKEKAKAEEEALAQKRKQAELDRKAAELAEASMKAQEARAKLLQETSYSTFIARKQEQDFRETRAVDNQARYDAQYGQSTDAFGGDGTAYRDAQEDRNKALEKAFNRQRYQEHELELKAQDEEQRRIDALVLQTTIENQNRELERQLQIYSSIAGKVEGALLSPMEDFYKHLGSANKDLLSNFSALFSGIQDAFGNMLANMVAQLTTKAAVFGVLNLLSGGGSNWASTALNNFSWFANGTDYAYGGTALVGERGPELVNLPRGSRVSSSTDSTAPVYHVTIHNQGSSMSEADIIRILRKEQRISGR